MRHWITIETAAGVVVGSGPIITAAGWRQTARLDRAGEFSFTMPASDPKAANLLAKYVVRCYGIVNGVVAQLGAGIIDKVSTRVDNGVAMLQVEGPDLLSMLTYRTVGELEMANHNIRLPQVWEWDNDEAHFVAYWTTLAAQANAGATQLTVANSSGFYTTDGVTLELDDASTWAGTVDGAPPDATHINITPAITAGRYAVNTSRVWHSPVIGYHPVPPMGASDCLYFGSSAQFDTLWVDVLLGNQRPNTAVWEYSKAAGAWQALTVEDGTVNLSHDDLITFSVPTSPAWVNTHTINGTANYYWIRVTFTDWHGTSTGTSDMHVNDIRVDTFSPSSGVPADIMALAPTGWSLGGDATTLTAITGMFSYENLLEALIKAAELTNEHFRLGSGKVVTWLNSALTASGKRALVPSDLNAAASDTTTCYIVSVEKSRDTYDLASRVIPLGGGDGDAALTLANTTRTASAGYTLSKASNYLKHDATETTYGQIERVLRRTDIRPADHDYGYGDRTDPLATPAAIEAAANQLYDYAKAELDRLRSDHQAYSLTVTKLDGTLLVGTTIEVKYDHWVDGYHAVAIDADLVILETTTQVDQEGVRTVALTIADVPWWPTNDIGQVVKEARSTKAYRMHAQRQALRALATGFQAEGDAVLLLDGIRGVRTWELANISPFVLGAPGGDEWVPRDGQRIQSATYSPSAAGWKLDEDNTKDIILGNGDVIIDETGVRLKAYSSDPTDRPTLAFGPEAWAANSEHGEILFRDAATDYLQFMAYRRDSVDPSGLPNGWWKVRLYSYGTTAFDISGVSGGSIGSVKLALDSAGKLYLLGGLGIGIACAATPMLHVAKDQAGCEVYVEAFKDTSVAAILRLRRGRGTLAAPTIVADTDAIGQIIFQGYDAATVAVNAASIQAHVDGTPSAGGADMPGRLTFWTTPDGSGTLAERMRIYSTGGVHIGGTAADPGTNNLRVQGVYYVGANQVVGARGAHVADATGAGDIVAQFNTLLSRLETHGLLATS